VPRRGPHRDDRLPGGERPTGRRAGNGGRDPDVRAIDKTEHNAVGRFPGQTSPGPIPADFTLNSPTPSGMPAPHEKANSYSAANRGYLG